MPGDGVARRLGGIGVAPLHTQSVESGVSISELRSQRPMEKHWTVQDFTSGAGGGVASAQLPYSTSQVVGVGDFDVANVNVDDGMLADVGTELPGMAEEGATGLLTPPTELVLDDVLDTDFSAGFDLTQDLWQYG